MEGKMKPRIGVTVDKIISQGYCYESINEYNLKALILSGATPLMLPITGEDELIDEYLEMSEEEKNKISHRSNALKHLRIKLEEALEDFGNQ
jgi:hypothetical protein